MKNKYKQIIIAMWFVSIITVITGCFLFQYSSKSIAFVLTGTSIALLSEKVIDKYED